MNDDEIRAFLTGPSVSSTMPIAAMPPANPGSPSGPTGGGNGGGMSDDDIKQFLGEPPAAPQMGTTEDMVRSGASGLARGVQSMVDVPAAALATGVEKLTGSQGTMADLFRKNLGNGLNAGTDKILGPEYQPKTEAGTLAKGAGMGVASLPLGGTGALAEGAGMALTRAAASGAASTAGSQAGGVIGQAVGGDTGEAIGSAVGGLAGGLGGAYAPEATGATLASKGVQNFAKGVQEGVPVPKTAQDYHTAATASYKKAADLGGVLSPKVTNDFLDNAANKLVPQTIEGKTVAGNSEVTQLAERIQGLRDKPITLAGAQEIDEQLGDVMDGMVDPKTGKLNKQGMKVQDLQSAFRNTIDNAAESDVAGGKDGFDALVEARQNWKTMAQLRDVEKIITRADMTDNPATSIKTGFRTLYNNPSRIRGYSDEAKAAIKQAAETGIVTDALRVAGSRLIPMIAGAAGSAGGVLGALGSAAVGHAGSTAARGAAARLQLGRAGKVVSAITGQESPSMAQRLGAKFNRAPNPASKPSAVESLAADADKITRTPYRNAPNPSDKPYRIDLKYSDKKASK